MAIDHLIQTARPRYPAASVGFSGLDCFVTLLAFNHLLTANC